MEAFAALRATDPSRVGPYRLVGRLGSGGMGSVYVGRSRGGRTVAVKVVRPDLAEETGFRRRFGREIAAARRVNGAFTAGVVDADPDGELPWLATAYVPGMALDAAVDAHGPWPQGSVLALGAGLAEALTEVHAVGVVHRDLKPSNILLSQDGPRVIDFGISAVSETSMLTQTGAMIGTPGFMSPEQLIGEGTGPASDVFSLGAVLVYVATGDSPFGAGPVHVVPYRTVYEPPQIAGVPEGLREVVTACLEKEPARRPGVEQVLEEVLSRGAEDGGDDARSRTRIGEIGGKGWLPPLIAETVQSIADAALLTEVLSPVPVSEASQGEDLSQINSDPAAGSAPKGQQPESGAGVTQADTDAGAADWPAGPDVAEPQKDTEPTGRPAGITRRRALIGLTGVATAAGLGIGGWVVNTRNDGSQQTGTRRSGSHRPGSRRSGTLRWKTDRFIGDSPMADGDRSALLAASDGLVYAVDSESLYALSADRGVRKWTYGLGNDAAESTVPTVAGAVVYVGVNTSVHALRATTGKRLWTLHTSDDDVGVGQPILRGGAVYTVSYGAYQDSLYKVSAKTGDTDWKKNEDSLTKFVGWAGATVAVAGDTAYTHNDSVLKAWHVDSGRVRWRHDTDVSLQKEPIVADGRCFACGSNPASDARFVYALSADTGKELWKVRFAGAMDVDSDFDGIQVVSGGVALLYTGPKASDAGLRALDTETGKVKWKRRFDSTVLSPPIVAHGKIYIAADESLYALRVDTGKTAWRSSLGTLVRQKPVVVDDTIYLSAPTGKIYAVWV